MKYGLQHNGKGVYHLIPEDAEDSKELCGTGGIFLFSHSDELEVVDGKLYVIDVYAHNSRNEIPYWEMKSYCKKCIKKALKNNQNEKTI
jgi:hypothetical protein